MTIETITEYSKRKTIQYILRTIMQLAYLHTLNITNFQVDQLKRYDSSFAPRVDKLQGAQEGESESISLSSVRPPQ